MIEAIQEGLYSRKEPSWVRTNRASLSSHLAKGLAGWIPTKAAAWFAPATATPLWVPFSVLASSENLSAFFLIRTVIGT